MKKIVFFSLFFLNLYAQTNDKKDEIINVLNKDIIDIYYNYALNEYKLKNYDAALKHIKSALLIDKNQSDSLFLYSKLLFKRKKYRDSYLILDYIFKNKYFLYINDIAFLNFYLKVLFILKEYNKLIEISNKYLQKNDFINNFDSLIYMIKAYYYTKQYNKLFNILKKYSILEDTESIKDNDIINDLITKIQIYPIILDFKKEYGFNIDIFESYNFNTMDYYNEYYRSNLLKLIYIEPQGVTKQELIDKYIFLGGNSPDIYILDLLNKDNYSLDEEKTAINKFIYYNGLDYKNMINFLLKNLSKKALTYLKDKFNSINELHSYYDSNEDGYYEQEYHYKNGKLLDISFDQDQDKINDIKIYLNDKNIIRLDFNTLKKDILNNTIKKVLDNDIYLNKDVIFYNKYPYINYIINIKDNQYIKKIVDPLTMKYYILTPNFTLKDEPINVIIDIYKDTNILNEIDKNKDIEIGYKNYSNYRDNKPFYQIYFSDNKMIKREDENFNGKYDNIYYYENNNLLKHYRSSIDNNNFDITYEYDKENNIFVFVNNNTYYIKNNEKQIWNDESDQLHNEKYIKTNLEKDKINEYFIIIDNIISQFKNYSL